MLIYCTISTPQFIGKGKKRMHTQSGTFNTESLLFTPHQTIGGNHPVQFQSTKQFHHFKISEMLLNLTTLIKKYGLKIKGVIHIGAHHGQEVISYRQHGIGPIVLIEPCAAAFKILQEKFSTDQQIVLVNYACGAQRGCGHMNVETANKGQSNSLLQPDDHLRQYPDIKFTGREVVEIIPLDELSLHSDRYNMINSDCQGFEGEVYKGAKNTLHHIDYIYTEVNKNSVYKDCVLVEDLDNLLSDFKRVETGQWVNDSWSDALYIKKTLL